jgi:hypothetical protein
LDEEEPGGVGGRVGEVTAESIPEAGATDGVEQSGGLTEGEGTEMTGRSGEPLVEMVSIADVDLLDVPWTLGGPPLLNEVKVAIVADLPEVKYP